MGKRMIDADMLIDMLDKLIAGQGRLRDKTDNNISKTLYNYAIDLLTVLRDEIDRVAGGKN